MNLQTLAKLGDLLHKRTGLHRFFSVLSTVALTLGSVGASTATTLAAPLKAPLAATINTLHLEVVSARTEPKFPDGEPGAPGIAKGDPVTEYKYIIVRDDTGNPSQPTTPNCLPATDPDYPANCDWPSIHTMAGGSASAATEIVTQGDQTDFGSGITLDPGDYMISVVAENFKIDGQWFTVPLSDNGGTNPNVTVGVQPYPLPLATLRMQVFEDTSTNGQFDPQIEHGLAGFVGHINDVLAEVTTDWFGNPLCTQYDANHDPDGDSNGTSITVTRGTMHIGDLDQSASNTSATQWQATVTITVHDSNHNPVQGATVTGTWTNGSGTGSGGVGGTPCSSVTNASGQCTVTRTGISRNRLSMTFTVSNVTNGLLYQASDNHDPDLAPQNSTGTSITVPRPPP